MVYSPWFTHSDRRARCARWYTHYGVLTLTGERAEQDVPPVPQGGARRETDPDVAAGAPWLGLGLGLVLAPEKGPGVATGAPWLGLGVRVRVSVSAQEGSRCGNRRALVRVRGQGQGYC